jgi:hypothetical protein
MTVTVNPNRDVLSTAAKLTVAVAGVRDIEFTEGKELSIVDVTNDPIQALLTLGKKLPNPATTTSTATSSSSDAVLNGTSATKLRPNNTTVDGTPSTQQSEYWVGLCVSEISKDVLERANKQLTAQTYLIEPCLTVADIAFYVAVHTSMLGFGVDDRKTYAHLVRW